MKCVYRQKLELNLDENSDWVANITTITLSVTEQSCLFLWVQDYSVSRSNCFIILARHVTTEGSISHTVGLTEEISVGAVGTVGNTTIGGDSGLYYGLDVIANYSLGDNTNAYIGINLQDLQDINFETPELACSWCHAFILISYLVDFRLIQKSCIHRGNLKYY